MPSILLSLSFVDPHYDHTSYYENKINPQTPYLQMHVRERDALNEND